MTDEHFTRIQSITEAYSNRSLLDKRRALYQYTFPPINTEQTIAGLSLFDNNQVVLDVGCGSGNLLFKLSNMYPLSEYFGMDISAGIVHEADKKRNGYNNVHFLTGDVQNLPLPDRYFDRVIAMHMLYHVPDIHESLAQIGRVLKKDGAVVVSANSLSSKPTLGILKDLAAKLMNRNDPPNLTARFNIENGIEMVKAHFRRTDVHTFTSQIKLTAPEPYVDYFDSTREFWYPFPSDKEWQRVLKEVHRYLDTIIEEKGVFCEENKFGIILASGVRGSV